MKNIFKTIVLVALAVSCAKEIGNESTPDAATRIYNLSFAESTKTELSGTGSTRQVNWTSGDAIKYYTEPSQSSPASATVAMEGSNAYVTIPRGRADEFINAVYGASQLSSGSSSDNTMYVNSPMKNSQNYTSFSQAHLCAAFSDDIENPNLTFHNVAAILKFTSAAAIHKIVFRGNNNEVITAGSNGSLKITHSAGVLTVTPTSAGGTSVTIQTGGAESEFYIAVLPVNFGGGITVDCYDSNLELIATKKTTNAVNTVSSSGAPKILNLGNVQDWLNNPLPVAVDLGLSVKWARTNLGATVPEEYGDYFAWGETSPKESYTWSDYAFGASKNGPFSKYVMDAGLGTIDHKTVLDPGDDAAHAILGGDWRIPTKEEVEELMTKCQWTWTTRNGVSGYRVTSNVAGYSGVSIFLPANGMFGGTSKSDVGTVGNYWSSSISPEASYHAISPYFSQSYIKSGNCYRYFGLGIRPVEGAIVPVSAIEIPTSLELIIGKTAPLSATITPNNATYKRLTWVSSNESIVTVDDIGNVTAIALGTATITVYSANGLQTASSLVNVVEPPKNNGYEYVDLGLPSGTKWATMNVGATKPEEYGDRFAWGETEPKSDYSWATYKWCNGDYNKLTKYCTDSSYWDSSDPMDNKTALDLEDDAAHVNWGGSWRMPTIAERNELIDNCTWTWTDNYNETGVAGRIVTSNIAGYTDKSFFLPAKTNGGLYWTSQIAWSETASCVWFDRIQLITHFSGRCYGHSVRPVFGPSTSGTVVTTVVTTDFTIKDANLPQSSSAGLKDGTYKLGGYEFIIHAADKFYQAKSNEQFYLVFGKQGSYVQFPVIDGKALTKVEFLTGAGASENVIADIAKADGTRLNVNNDKLKKGTNYSWEVSGEPGVAYRFLVTNGYNMQFQTLTLTYQ